jgi:hypothetical protein
MGVDVQIATRIDLQVDQAVTGNLVEHVVKESNPGCQLGLAGAFQIEFDTDLSFQRRAVYVCSA